MVSFLIGGPPKPQYEFKESEFLKNYFRFGILYPENILKNTVSFLIRIPPKAQYGHKESEFRKNFFRFGILYPENIFKNTVSFSLAPTRNPPISIQIALLT